MLASFALARAQTGDPADAALDAPAGATASAADPADLVGAPAAESQPVAATPSPAPPVTDPADSVPEPPAPPSVSAATGTSASADVAEQVLAVTTPPATEEDDESYTELRKSIEAAVQVRQIESMGTMLEGILVRRGQKGAKGAPGRLGFTGVFRAISADLPPKNSFRFGSHFGFYTFDELWDGARQSHLDAIGFVSYSVRPDVELRIAGVASGHQSGTIVRLGQEALFQTLGDVYVGGKYNYTILPYLAVAGGADFRFFTKVRSFLLRGDATGLSLFAAGSLDFYRTPWFQKPVPLRAHATIGYTLDRSANLLRDVATQNASTFGGFGLAPGDQLPVVIAVEAIKDPVSGFFEYSFDQMLNNRARGIVAERPTFTQSPQRLTLGGRWNPYENLLLDTAIDLSFGLNKAVFLYGRPERPIAPYMLHVGVAYEWNPEGWEIIDMRGKVVGIVVDADTGAPLGGAVIEYVDSKKLTPQMSDLETGTFETFKIPPGEVMLRVSHEGYEPIVINPMVEEQETIERKIFLRRPDQVRGEQGVIVGKVIDEEGRAVTATIRFPGTDIGEIRSSPVDGSFVKVLPVGDYKVEVAAEGFEPKTYQVPIRARKKTTVSFQLLSGGEYGALAGAVFDADKRPLQATILFLDAQIDPLVTDALGQFAQPLPPGEYALEVRSRGYVSKRFKVPVQRGRKSVLEVELSEEQAVGVLAGRVVSVDGQPLAAVVTVDRPGVAPVPTDADSGTFEVVLPAGTYEIGIESQGYQTARYRIPVLAGKKTVQEFRLQVSQADRSQLAYLEGGKIVTREPVLFEPGSVLLRQDSYATLDAVANLFLRQPASARLEIHVHTHNLGPAEANRKLSQDRAREIRNYLVSLGLDGTRLIEIGKGEDFPLVPYDSPGMDPVEIRKRNERVEFVLRR